MFSCEFYEICKNTFFTEHLWATPSENGEYHFNCLDKALDIYSNFEKVLISGDFNNKIAVYCIETVLYEYELNNLVKG